MPRSRRRKTRRSHRGGRRRRRSRRGGQNWFTKLWDGVVGKKTSTTENVQQAFVGDRDAEVGAKGFVNVRTPEEIARERRAIQEAADKPSAAVARTGESALNQALDTASPWPTASRSAQNAPTKRAPARRARRGRPRRKADHAPPPPSPPPPLSPEEVVQARMDQTIRRNRVRMRALARERDALREQLAEHDRRQDAERAGQGGTPLRDDDTPRGLAAAARGRRLPGGRRFRKRTRRRKRKRRRSRRRRSRRR